MKSNRLLKYPVFWRQMPLSIFFQVLHDWAQFLLGSMHLTILWREKERFLGNVHPPCDDHSLDGLFLDLQSDSGGHFGARYSWLCRYLFRGMSMQALCYVPIFWVQLYLQMVGHFLKHRPKNNNRDIKFQIHTCMSLITLFVTYF